MEEVDKMACPPPTCAAADARMATCDPMRPTGNIVATAQYKVPCAQGEAWRQKTRVYSLYVSIGMVVSQLKTLCPEGGRIEEIRLVIED